jgi:hypothetical protein
LAILARIDLHFDSEDTKTGSICIPGEELIDCFLMTGGRNMSHFAPTVNNLWFLNFTVSGFSQQFRLPRTKINRWIDSPQSKSFLHLVPYQACVRLKLSL